MRIELKKFGDILTSREAGREALLAFSPTLKSAGEHEEIIIDFQGVSVLTPSWADEFLRPIVFEKQYAKKVSLINHANPSVQAALRFANPKLDLSTMTVLENTIVFDEMTHDAPHNAHETLLTLTFPYSDNETLRILANNRIQKISLHPVDGLSDSRLKAVAQMLNQAGVKAIIGRH